MYFFNKINSILYSDIFNQISDQGNNITTLSHVLDTRHGHAAVHHTLCLANNDKLCAWRHDMPPPLSSPRGRSSASPRAAEPTAARACRRQRSSNFPRSIRSHADRCSCLCVNAAVSKAAWWPWPLTIWPWKWCPSHVWRGLPLCQF